jgi:hypothetical protein
MQSPQRRRVKEIAQRLAEGTASPEAAQELRKLLEDLAQDSDFESLPEITRFIREHLAAGPLEEDRPLPTAPVEPEMESKAVHTPLPRVVMIVGSALALLVVIFLVARMFLSSAGSGGTSGSTSDQTPTPQETTAVVAKPEDAAQPAQVEITPGQAKPTEVTPVEATPTREITTPSPSPSAAKQEYTMQACVGWQSDPGAGLPGSTITWQTDSDESNQEEIGISAKDGCVGFPVSALPDSRITLWAKPPGDERDLQIVAGAEPNGDQLIAWEAVEEEGTVALATTLGEETSAEYVARFLIAAQRTFSGEVLNEEGAGIPGAEVHLWGRAGRRGDWDPINRTTTADRDGTFVLTDTTGLPQVFYRVGVSNTITNRYVYTTTSASGPDANWVDGENPQIPSVAWVETQTALGSDQLSVQDIVFNQELGYVSLGVQEAILEPEGLDWQTVSVSSDEDGVVSNLVTIDGSNIDRLQARWEDIELPPGTYALEIWTPENSSARVTYQVLSSGQLLDERASYQSTRQDRGEVNQWIDFSKTLNPSLVIELPASERVTVIAEPSPSTINREYNLSGQVVFGVGPVRFVKRSNR